MDNIAFPHALHLLSKMAKFVKIVILDVHYAPVQQIESAHHAQIYFIYKIIHAH